MCTANYSENPNHVEKPKFQMLSRKVSFADSDTETLLNSSSSRSNSPSKTAPEKPALSSKSPTLTASSEMKSPIHNRSQYKPRAGNSMPLLTQTAIDKLGKKHTAHYCAQAIATAFRLRTGPNYSSRKLKVPSGEAFMELVGMDFVRTPKGRMNDIGSHVRIPAEWRSVDTGHPKIPPVFIVNLQATETYKSTMFGDPIDTPGLSFVFYFKMKQETVDALADMSTASPALRLFADYLINGPEAFADMMEKRRRTNSAWGVFDNKYYGRFKVILRGDNIREPCMSWLPSVAVGYNEKPTVTTHSNTLIRGDGYCEVDIDSRCFGPVSNWATPIMLRNLHHSVNTVAFCIESVREEEMPERVFGCAQMAHFNTKNMPSI